MALSEYEQESIKVGTRVILGEHTDVDGYDSNNWNGEMDRYVGMKTTISILTGHDTYGCRTARVKIDNGRWNWRLENMAIVNSGKMHDKYGYEVDERKAK